MRMKKAFWASIALTPAAIIPLSTATSCSQAWGFKTPISIGSSIKDAEGLDPFCDLGDDSMVDLDCKPIQPQLQSNYAIDTKSNNYYGYSLPQKWDSNATYTETDTSVTWDKGNFVEGNAGWCDYSSSEFVKSANRSGTRKSDNKKVSETIFSYRNNTLASTIQLVGNVGSTISSYMNYALQYQGTQIGKGYTKTAETDSDLAVSWGGNITHGEQGSVQNRQFYESIFAANAVGGTGKAKAALHPSHVEFEFDVLPIVAYAQTDNKITGVHDATLRLLNNEAKRPEAIINDNNRQYWSSRSDEVSESIYDIRHDRTDEYKYRVYEYTNVPVIVYFNSFVKTYVNPTKNDSFIVSDFYSEKKDITDAIGNSWKGSLSKFATSGDETPKYRTFIYEPTDGAKELQPLATGDQYDQRLADPTQNCFIVLMNYAYKEYESGKVNGQELSKAQLAALDRVTMTGVNTVFPAYFLDAALKLGNETTFFKIANKIDDGKEKGYIIDADKVNKYSNLFFELVKRSAGQGLVTQATKLNDTSKQLLKFLGYMFGDETYKVDTSNIITTPYEL